MFYALGHFSKFIRPGAVRISSQLQHGLTCVPNIGADPGNICNTLNWVADNLIPIVTDPSSRDCLDGLQANAVNLFTQYYNAHSNVQGPAACDFAGLAHLEGLQTVAFLNSRRCKKYFNNRPIITVLVDCFAQSPPERGGTARRGRSEYR
jgi:hypothetical protein